ncbi:uncharacterized protein LOC114329649 isoform X2 [Diabrotica virgifera virgifera]|nr:uncharacterized protein LOC114329649 isoform X2 [Diabrotica virgifera virgifera]
MILKQSPRLLTQVDKFDKMGENNIKENLLVGLGNPLLDISAVVNKQFLDKYELKENDAILADDRHRNLYEDITENYKVSYIAGGSVQNTLRVAQWLLGTPNVVTKFGCVGKDKYSKILHDKATESGVNVRYQYHESEPTGTCAVLITGQHRSLCAKLGSSGHFSVEHLRQPENRKLLENAQFFYVSGYFLSANREAQIEANKIALRNDRPFMLNLSAPIVCQIFAKDILETLPYVDVLFGNESEAESISKSLNLGSKNVEEIALKLSELPKENKRRKRLVVITQGVDPVVYAFEGQVKSFPVVKLPEDKIVDTNGAGDAFVGGFLAQFILNKSLDVCVKCGIWAASEIIQRNGCSFEGKPNFN